MAAAAVALTKNTLFKSRRRPHCLPCFWLRISTKHSIPEASKNIADHFTDQLRLSKWRSRFPLSFFRKSKDISTFCLRGSSTSRKLGWVSWYLGMVQARPVSTKSITCAFIYTAADLSSQTIMGESSEGYDLVRTLRMAGYGLLIIGPSLHYWFNFVSRLFPKRDIFSTIKKMGMGQMVYGPTVTAIFFSANAALQGENGNEIVGRLKRDLIPTLISGIMYWPVCDFVTFKFVPLHLQPLVSNSFSYLWTVYLTYMASSEKATATYAQHD